jgi:hypothetical protein
LVKILFAGVFGVVYYGSFCATIIPNLQQTGINPITFGKTDIAHDYIGFVMKVLIALLFVAVFIIRSAIKYINI